MKSELARLARVAWPLVIARLATMMLAVTDTLIAGTLGANAVAALGLASTTYFLLQILPQGTVMGFEPLAAQALGAGRPAEALNTFRVARRMALGSGLVFGSLCFVAPWVLEQMGQPSSILPDVRAYLSIMSAYAPAALLFHAYAGIYTVLGRTRPLLVTTLGANGLNVGLGLWFAHGGLGVPAMGVAGLAVSTVMCAVFAVAVLHALLPSVLPVAAAGPISSLAREVRGIVGIGLPIGVQYLLEVSGFSIVTFLMGWKGEIALAAHQVAINVTAIFFMIAVGISGATSAQVGHAVGAGSREDARRAGGAGLLLGVGVSVAGVVVLSVFADAVATFYVRDAATVAAAVTFMGVAAIFQLFDATQAIGFGILRGLGDTRVPVLFNLIGYYGIGLPLGAWLAFGVTDDGVWLWWGLTVALAIVAAALIVRFHRLTRPDAELRAIRAH